jgi:hypothetical protein
MLSIDDKLTDETKTLINTLMKTNNSEAFVYALGIFSAIDENPAVVGKSLLKKYKESELNESHVINEYPATKKLPLPTGELFCHFREDKCLDILFYSGTKVEDLIKKHEVLSQRTITFYNFSEYTTLTKPFISEYLPPLQYISAAARLQLLNAIKIHQNGDSQRAMSELNSLLFDLRNALSLQDTLIGKMLFLQSLSDVVDTMSIIYHQSNTRIDKIAPLNVSEKTLAQAFAREFAMYYNTFEDISKQPEHLRKGVEVPLWIIRLWYKPNMTTNAIAPFFKKLALLSGLPHVQFVKEIKKVSTVDLSTSNFRNYYGNYIIALSLPSYDKYISRLLDFDAKLMLFNHLDKDIETAPNPYYKYAIPVLIDDKVCFEGPLEDPFFIRCLRTNVSP